MATKQDIDALWADLKSRLSEDPKLLKVLESIDKNSPKESEEDRRPRLRVPYASTNSIGDDAVWN